MKQWIRTLVVPAAALVAVGLTACDDTPAVPQAVLDESNKPTDTSINKRPTTQSLLSGTRSRSALIPLPLTMEMPEGWGKPKDMEAAPGHLLQGYTPNGDVQIQLASRPVMKKERLDQLIEGAKKEMAKNPAVKVELRDMGSSKVLERQSVGQPRPLTVYDDQGVPHTTTEAIFNWTYSVLVPFEGAYQVYELNFIGLTKSQYDKDKDFLEGILKTIQYAGDGGSAASLAPATPSAPAAPAPAAAPGSSTAP